MRNVMVNGDLEATIDLDTIVARNHLFGVGPLDRLSCEILILDGTSYRSTAGADGSIRVEKTFRVRAPFFVYARVENWRQCALPDSVQTVSQLDHFLSTLNTNSARPFCFRLEGRVESAQMHVVNLPSNAEIKMPSDTRLGQIDIYLRDQDVDLVGFFSKVDKGIFTHHDSNVHIHLITRDRSRMGHLDEIHLKVRQARLYVSE